MANEEKRNSKAAGFWSVLTSLVGHFIQSGRPMQNGFIESGNGKFRDYCLNLNRLASACDVRDTIDASCHQQNYEKPHRSLCEQSLGVFTGEAAC